MNVLLSTTYFGPIEWYQMLCQADHAKLECYESFQKQTYRNRCIIATANGPQSLTVPVSHNDELRIKGEKHALHSSFIKDIRLSDHGDWRRLHWNALTSAYGESPFFDYYQDDLRPFFESRQWTYLLDFNEAIREVVCQLLDVHPHLSRTSTYHREPDDGWIDFRSAISPKHPTAQSPKRPISQTTNPPNDQTTNLPNDQTSNRPYYQVYRQKHGFLPNLSILDLLFNMGPEGIFWLVA
jgi:hypothetical protein